MADKKKNDQSSGTLDSASANVWVRSVKLLLERLGKKAGERLGTAESAQGLFGKIEKEIGSRDLSKLLEGAAFLVPVLLQDTVFARLLQRSFRISPDLARELSNEGLDSLLESFFDKVRTGSVGKNSGQQNAVIQSAVRDFEEEAKNLLMTKHPELFKDVLHVHATNRAHEMSCTLVREGGGVTKRTLHDVQQMGGEMTRECSCVGAQTDPAGSFQQAYRRLGILERERFDQLLMGSLADIRPQVLAHTGATSKITMEDLRIVLETDEKLRKERLLALLGIGAPKSKSKLEKLSDLAVDTATVGLEKLSDQRQRAAFREDTRRSTSALGRTRSRIRGV